jgi:hypothetical protein
MRSLVMCGLIVMLLVGAALASVPKTMSYQGMLRDYDGNIVPDGNYSVIFRIYDVESEGTPLWGEPDTVAVADGVFSTILGDLYVLELPFDRQYWLSIEVESTGELSPRIQLTSSPYARMAGGFDLPNGGSLDVDVYGFSITNTIGGAMYGNSGDGTGVTGVSANFEGVRGTGPTGVCGYTDSGVGVFGRDQGSGNYGLLASATSGVYGVNATGATEGGLGYGLYGVYGKGGPTGFAGQFDGRVQVISDLTVGGQADVAGFKLTTSPVAGYVLTSDAAGVGRWQASGAGTLTLPYGGSVSSVSPAFSITNLNAGVVTAVQGVSQYGYGIHGKSTGNIGVWGEGKIYGVFGQTDSSHAVEGTANANSTHGFLGSPDYGALGMHGVSGDYGALGMADYGVFGYAPVPDYAGYFDGSAKITRDLEVGNIARIQGTTWPASGKSMELAYDSGLHRGYIQVYDRAGGPTAWGDLYMGNTRVGFGTSAPARLVHIKDVMRLEPRSDYPTSPSDGDLCVVGASGSRHIYCYLNGAWKQLD